MSNISKTYYDLLVRKAAILDKYPDISLVLDDKLSDAFWPICIPTCSLYLQSRISSIENDLKHFLLLTSCLKKMHRANMLTKLDMEIMELAIETVYCNYNRLMYDVGTLLSIAISDKYISEENLETVEDFVEQYKMVIDDILTVARNLAEKYNKILDIPKFRTFEEEFAD